MRHLYDGTDDRFKPLIGKRIQFKNKEGRLVVGTLEFAGVNTKLHQQFQVTVDRTPFWPVDPKTIKEIVV